MNLSSFAARWLNRPHMGRRVALLLCSVILMGLCVAVFDQIGFGTDPCSVLNLAASRKLGMDFGTYQLIWNAILLALILLCGESRRIGLGTLANMSLVGYAADFFSALLFGAHPLAGESLMIKAAAFVPTMLLFLGAAALYMVVELGVAPYDAIPQIIAARQRRFSFTVVRMAWDIACTLLGFLLGGTVGLVTVITCFFLGPAITAAAGRIKKYL